MTKRKPNGFWKKWENVQPILDTIIKELGHFPTQRDLKDRGQSVLAAAITLYHGGFYQVAIRTGYTSRKLPKKFWKDFSNIRSEILQLSERLGYFPSTTEIRQYNRMLEKAIYEYYGGIHKVRERLSIDSERNRHGFWKNWDNVQRELIVIIGELGHFPRVVDLKEMNKHDLLRGIYSWHDGLNQVKKKLGYTIERKESNYWRQWDNLEQELITIMQSLGHFPTYQELKSNGYQSVSSAISRYHGGSDAVKKKMIERKLLQTEEQRLEILVQRYVGE